MFINIIYTIWRLFWSSILVLLLSTALFAGLLLILLQTEPARDYLAEKTELWFNEHFEGTLQIGAIRGFLPLRTEFHQVRLKHGDELVASFESLAVQADLIALFRNQVTISDIALRSPVLSLIKGQSGHLTLSEALRQRVSTDDDDRLAIPEINIFAPFVRVFNGYVHIEPDTAFGLPFLQSEPLLIENLHTEMFLEVSADQRYLDISYLTLNLAGSLKEEFVFSGQIYNDERFLELNALRMRLGNSYMDWHGEFEGINLMEAELARQFRDADYRLEFENVAASREHLLPWLTGIPPEISSIRFLASAEGRYDRLHIRNAIVRAGNSELRLKEGELLHLMDPALLSYRTRIDALQMDQKDLENFLPFGSEHPASIMASLPLQGEFEGSLRGIEMFLDVGVPSGVMHLTTHLDLSPPFAARINLDVEQVDLSFLDFSMVGSTRLNGQMAWSTPELAATANYWQAEMELHDSEVDQWRLPLFHIQLARSENLIRHEFSYGLPGSTLDGSGNIDISREIPRFTMSGMSSGMDLSDLATRLPLPATDWNMSYNVNWRGWHPDQWQGRFVVDVQPSKVNGSDLSSHHLYLDLNPPTSPFRSLRITSSVLDLIMEGTLNLSDIGPLYSHWYRYFTGRIEEELLFDSMESFGLPSLADDLSAYSVIPYYGPQEWIESPASTSEVKRLKAGVQLQLKNLELLRAYFPALPDFQTRSRLELDVEADLKQLSMQSRLDDMKTSWGPVSADNLQVRLNTDFRSELALRERSLFDLDIRMDQLNYHGQPARDVSLMLQVINDSLYSKAAVGYFANEVRLSTEWSGSLAENEINTRIHELTMGTDRYLWQSDGEPELRFQSNNRLEINNLRLASGNDHVLVDGVLSASENDSVQYRIHNVDLERISSMVQGRINFQGILDGELVTRNLADRPAVYGQLSVDRLAFDDRPMGDLELSSMYDADLNRFNTSFFLYTDSLKYKDYLDRNNGIGQNLSASGWFRLPDLEAPADTLYYMDVDFEMIDAWVMTYLLDQVFESIEGRGSGSGYLAGNREYIDFDGRFRVDEVRVVPVFFGPQYSLTGDVQVSRNNGVAVQELLGVDEAGGTGTITGRYDFNDFQSERYMDFTLNMNNLRFLDNSDGPDIPFFGRVAGTGTVNISGSNISPFVRTIEPIHTTSQSQLSIPFADMGMDADQGRFIRFVRDFSEIYDQREDTEDPDVLRQIDRTFMEVFRLDLQFVAAPNSTVQLIFDPVTGEIVHSRGSGRFRVTLEDETLQIFGNFDISDGDYLFVGGDILTRRFTLREGGSIRWEGDPANALLDITAVYRSRPNIAPLLGAATEQTNRVPVELLMVITGPMDAIENDFYFEFPNAIDATQNAAVLNILNSEEQKLIQATSLLFTGGFISGTLVGDTQTQELGMTLQARAGQVGISQLLSSQINALLSENLVNLDVDINLFGFDQADLGIGLRLFDDRLVLRREGEVGGEDPHIGDLGATYRINPNLSIEVFHRKDPMLMSILGAQAEVENVNGVGLEAQFRFNSWKELRQRFWSSMRSLFGLRQRYPGESEESEGLATAH